MYYLIPEQTLPESVSLTESQLISASKNHPTENNNPLNAEEDPESKQNEDEEIYVNKVCLIPISKHIYGSFHKICAFSSWKK